MGIRIRKVDGMMVAVCAAETDAEPDDIYWDDSVHMGLVTKFSEDYDLGISEPELVARMETQKRRDAQEEIEKWLAEHGGEESNGN